MVISDVRAYGNGIEIVRVPEQEPNSPATDWSPLIDAFNILGKSGQQQAAPVAPTKSVPDWVYIAAPLGVGVLVFGLALASKSGGRRLDGYSKRKRRSRKARR